MCLLGKDIIFDILPECFWFVYNSQNGTSLKLSYIFPFSNSFHQEKRSIVACRASIQMDWFARILIIEILVGMNLKRHILPLDTGCKLTVMLRRHLDPYWMAYVRSICVLCPCPKRKPPSDRKLEGNVFLLSQNCHFYSCVLIFFDPKFVTCSENLSSKFNCPILKILVQPVPSFSRF